MKNKAFTLAEVLITLVIIGVIAAMTIPTLMGNINKQDYKAKIKKGLSAVNQALALDYVLYGNKVTGQSGNGPVVTRMLTNHMNVIEENIMDWGYLWFRTADGMYYSPNPDSAGDIMIKWDNKPLVLPWWCSDENYCDLNNINGFQLTICPNSDHSYCANTTYSSPYVYD